MQLGDSDAGDGSGVPVPFLRVARWAAADCYCLCVSSVFLPLGRMFTHRRYPRETSSTSWINARADDVEVSKACMFATRVEAPSTACCLRYCSHCRRIYAYAVVATAANTTSTTSSRVLLRPEACLRDQCTSQTNVKAVAPVKAAPTKLVVATLNSCGPVAWLGKAGARKPLCSPRSWEATRR